jgi:hypothetical protein
MKLPHMFLLISPFGRALMRRSFVVLGSAVYWCAVVQRPSTYSMGHGRVWVTFLGIISGRQKRVSLATMPVSYVSRVLAVVW